MDETFKVWFSAGTSNQDPVFAHMKDLIIKKSNLQSVKIHLYS